MFYPPISEAPNRSFKSKVTLGETVAKTAFELKKSGFFQSVIACSRNFQNAVACLAWGHPLMQREGAALNMMPYLTVDWQGDGPLSKPSEPRVLRPKWCRVTEKIRAFLSMSNVGAPFGIPLHNYYSSGIGELLC
jgi:hypothetical protein